MDRVRLPLETIVLLSILVWVCCCGAPSPPPASTEGFEEYFGMAAPGLAPELFAPSILPPEGAVMHSSPSFSPDGTEVYFSAFFADQEPRVDVIMFLEWQGDSWSVPQIAAFSGEFSDNWPWFSRDGSRIYFSSRRPAEGEGQAAGQDGLWYVERRFGGWSAPSPIATPADFGRDEGPVYVAATLPGGYGDMDIYRLEFSDGTYSMPDNLGPAVNTAAEEYGPCAAPDESFVAFTRFEQAPERNVDLYVTFRQADGTWAEAQNMGEQTEAFRGGRFPALSPEGRYLFFVAEGGEAIYWVDATVVEQFRAGQ